MKFNSIKIYFYSITTILVIIVTTLLFVSFSKSQKQNYNAPISHISSIALNYNFEFFATDQVNQQLFIAKQERKVEIEKNIKNAKLQKITDLFKAYNSPMIGYEELIFNRAMECGGDYKVLIGIAGAESGLGRIPYKLYNPYGYLDGKQYSGWEESLSFLSCVISERFLRPCENNLTCIINKYAGPKDDKSLWIRNVTYFINELE